MLIIISNTEISRMERLLLILHSSNHNKYLSSHPLFIYLHTQKKKIKMVLFHTEEKRKHKKKKRKARKIFLSWSATTKEVQQSSSYHGRMESEYEISH